MLPHGGRRIPSQKGAGQLRPRGDGEFPEHFPQVILDRVDADE
jgi:hypothetical protein